MSNPFRPRQRLRMRSGSVSSLGNGLPLSCLGSLGVPESLVALGDECSLEDCECQEHLAKLAQSFEILSDEAFTLGEFTITPLRPR